MVIVSLGCYCWRLIYDKMVKCRKGEVRNSLCVRQGLGKNCVLAEQESELLERLRTDLGKWVGERAAKAQPDGS